jgi:hypothetical protein
MTVAAAPFVLPPISPRPRRISGTIPGLTVTDVKRHLTPRLLAILPAALLALPFIGDVSTAQGRTPVSSSRALQLLPNVQAFAPFDLSVERGGNKRRIRLSAEVANAGAGPLEIFPIADDCDGDGNFEDDRSGYQRVFADADGDGVFTRDVDVISSSTFAGCFLYHPEHGHWHFEGWARYDLSRLSDGKVLASSGKVSFCVIDTSHPYPGLPGSPVSSYYVRCDADATEGLSVGWSDVYAAGLAGQTVNVNRVRDGTYCLSVTADPDDVLSENDEADNRVGTTVVLAGATISDLGTSC